MEAKDTYIVIATLVACVSVFIALLTVLWIVRQKRVCQADDEKAIETDSTPSNDVDTLQIYSTPATPPSPPLPRSKTPSMHAASSRLSTSTASLYLKQMTSPNKKKKKPVSSTCLDDLPIPPVHLPPTLMTTPTYNMTYHHHHHHHQQHAASDQHEFMILPPYWHPSRRDSALSSSASTLPRAASASSHDIPANSSSILTLTSLHQIDMKQQQDELHQQWMSSYQVW
ncbi:hypothetical protein BC940DRAFT_304512 [Gongronella butleri]|nr:hypothetical protein BC940DRAFT_304512 [Gongronella butleri]